jgi:hypothetical protein
MANNENLEEKRKGGRPTKMTVETLRKLEDCFTNAMTDDEACIYVGITPPALYDYCKKNPSFLIKKEGLKKKVGLKAKMNIVKSITKDNNVQDSKWWAERKMKEEFSLRVENINQDTKELELYDNERMRYIKKRVKGESETSTD